MGKRICIRWLWFDVGIKRYTTASDYITKLRQLWFDVGIKRYTTKFHKEQQDEQLWFDVGIKRYTTNMKQVFALSRCGLM